MAKTDDFVARDRELSKVADKAGEELARHRWHWTLDETNPDRVSIRQYARDVGVSEKAIRLMARGYADWKDAEGTSAPGAPVTLADHIERATLGVERQEATEAVAAARGTAFSTAATHHRDEVKSTLATARERAERKGTNVSDELHEVASFRERSRKAAAKDKDDRKARSTLRYIELEGHLGAAIGRLRQALGVAEAVDFSDDEIELLTETLGKLRGLLGLIDMRLTGQADVDWDREFEKLMGGAA